MDAQTEPLQPTKGYAAREFTCYDTNWSYSIVAVDEFDPGDKTKPNQLLPDAPP